MDLTKEYLDEKLSGLATKEDLKGFATKEDLIEAVKPLAIKDELSELARMTADGFAEAAKQRSVEAIWRELTDVRKIIDKMFEQIDKNIEMRLLHEEELLELRTRVEKLENSFKKINVQGV